MRKMLYLPAFVLVFTLNSADSFSQSPSGGPIRTVLALGRVDGPFQEAMQINLARVVIPPGTPVRYLGASAMVYLTTGQLMATIGNDKRAIHEGEGVHIPANVQASFESSKDGKSELLIYRLLSEASDTAASVMSAPASSTLIHRMKLPSSLKSGPFEFSMTRVTLPAGASRPRPHTRSGAALYYVLTEGSITIWPEATVEALKGENLTESRATGAIQEEPYGFIHSWSPTSQNALILLQANISQEGTPEIIFVK